MHSRTRSDAIAHFHPLWMSVTARGAGKGRKGRQVTAGDAVAQYRALKCADVHLRIDIHPATRLVCKILHMPTTRLESFLKSRGIKPAHLARESGYSRQHLLRIRMGRMEPTRRCIAAIASACRRLVRARVSGPPSSSIWKGKISEQPLQPAKHSPELEMFTTRRVARRGRRPRCCGNAAHLLAADGAGLLL